MQQVYLFSTVPFILTFSILIIKNNFDAFDAHDATIPSKPSKQPVVPTTQDWMKVVVRKASRVNVRFRLMIDDEFVDTQIQRFLAHKQQLPQRPVWSRYALSQYLKKQGLLGSQKATISEWEREFCFYIKDFRKQIPADTPRDKDGKPLTIYPLSPYQAATIVRISYALTQLRPYLNGSKYTYMIQALVKNREIQRKYFSYQVFVYDQHTAA